MDTGVETLEAHDGLELFCQTYLATAPKGVIITLHDYGEHSGIYKPVYDRFAHEGYSVHTFDLRGHGKSPGERAFIDHFDYFLEDLDLLFARIKDRIGKQPIFLLGQGVGALIAARFASSRRPHINGLILCAPVMELPLTSLERMLGHYARSFTSYLHVGPAVRHRLLHPAIAGQLKEDSLAFRGPVRLGTACEILEAAKALRSDQPCLNFPVLTLCGQETAELVADLHESFLTHEKEFLSYAGNDHHLLLHPERDQVIGDILEWCDGHRTIEVESPDEDDEWENDAL